MPKCFYWILIFTSVLTAFAWSPALAEGLTIEEVLSSSFVVGEEGRYTIKFRTNNPLNLSTGAAVSVGFSPGFGVIREDIYSRNPGCTLANIQYKEPQAKHFAVLEGSTQVKRSGQYIQFTLLPTSGGIIVPANTALFLTVPGVINPAAPGTEILTLTVVEQNGQLLADSLPFLLGRAPKEIPQDLRIAEASSYKVTLAWSPLHVGTGCKVYFATQPDGQYIEALDFSREPEPGESWIASNSIHPFSARGNGGLKPGQTYYFTVRGVNQFGAGPQSSVLAVTLPSVKLLHTQPTGREQIADDKENIILATVDQPVKIAVADKIRIYEKQTGLRVKNVQATIAGKNNDTVEIKTALRPGTTYQVVFYEGALKSAISALRIVNSNEGWVFTTAGRETGGI